MTVQLKPIEYLKVWEQTGVEPSFDQLKLPLLKEPSLDRVQLKALSIYFSDSLSYVLKNAPHMVRQVLNSKLSNYLKNREEQGDFILSGISEEKSPPWYAAIYVALSSKLPFSHEATKEIFGFVKNHLDSFRNTKYDEETTVPKNRHICQLLLSLYSLVACWDVRKLSLEEKRQKQQNDQIFEEIFDMCALEEKEGFLKGSASHFCDKNMFVFVVKKVKENPNLNLVDPDFYHAILMFVGGESSNEHYIAEALSFLNNKDLRNAALNTSILFLAEKIVPSLENKSFPQSRERLFACLPPEDKDVIIESLRASSLNTKSWPQTFKNHLEKKEIKNAIKKRTGSPPSPPTKKM